MTERRVRSRLRPGERRRRAALARQGGPSGIVRWLATQSVWDVLPAVVFAVTFGPLIAADITRS